MHAAVGAALLWSGYGRRLGSLDTFADFSTGGWTP